MTPQAATAGCLARGPPPAAEYMFFRPQLRLSARFAVQHERQARATDPVLPLREAPRDRERERLPGAALAAVTFAVFLATGICVVASVQFEDVLNWTGPNLSGSQLIVYANPPQNGPLANALSSTQLTESEHHVSSLATSLGARAAMPLEVTGATLYQAGAQTHRNFSGTVYVATPQLLATYGITAGQIAPGTDILTMRPGMASLPDMELTWGDYGLQQGPGGFTHKDSVLPSCTLSSDCLATPRMQTISSLPGGTSAPNTVITQYAVSKYQLQTHLAGWLIQAPAPLTAAQASAARQFALTYGATVETESASLGPGEIADGATALGIVIALGVLAASVGLIRSETAPDLRTLTATGASTTTRRTTAAALGLLGAILGMAGAMTAGLAWARSSLSVVFGDVPLTDVLILLPRLPLTAAAAGWLLAGREPKVIARQPLD